MVNLYLIWFMYLYNKTNLYFINNKKLAKNNNSCVCRTVLGLGNCKPYLTQYSLRIPVG